MNNIRYTLDEDGNRMLNQDDVLGWLHAYANVKRSHHCQGVTFAEINTVTHIIDTLEAI